LGAIDSTTCASVFVVTHSHTMQEPLPDRPTPVSALTPAGGRKEMTMNSASPGILVGFAG
jgi:hypothetical protein